MGREQKSTDIFKDKELLTPQNYIDWLSKCHKIDVAKCRKHYDMVALSVKKDFEESQFWKQLCANLTDYHFEYMQLTKYPLLPDPAFLPTLLTKSWGSFLDKTRRKNVLQNDCWPNERKGGWILPSNWYTEINDIVRTSIIVKYLDGVEFLVEKTHSLCAQNGNSFDRCDWEAKEEGYYAAQVYIKNEYEIPTLKWDTHNVIIKIEIEITTQIQDVIKKLLHEGYEQSRCKIKTQPVVPWQWNYQSGEFKVNYLGHILHYMEGMIMEIRGDKEKDHEKLENRV